MEAGSYGLALTSVMDTEEGFERLKKGAAADRRRACRGTGEAGNRHRYDGAVHNEIVISLREAYDGEKETVLLQESEGRIAGEFLYLYPPGIPLLMPGERISREVLERVAFFRRKDLPFRDSGIIRRSISMCCGKPKKDKRSFPAMFHTG
ncbi:MAG: hypothetical protein ACLR6B_04760 [Blautia sp.]